MQNRLLQKALKFRMIVFFNILEKLFEVFKAFAAFKSLFFKIQAELDKKSLYASFMLNFSSRFLPESANK